MPENQDQQRRTSGRSTQGIPPARFQQVKTKMSVSRSPAKPKTPSHDEQNPSATFSTPTASEFNLQPPLQPQKPAANSPATPSQSQAKNEMAELKKQMKFQMEQMQRQMQAMQNAFLASTKQMQLQLLATSQQVQTQLANYQPKPSAQPTLPEGSAQTSQAQVSQMPQPQPPHPGQPPQPQTQQPFQPPHPGQPPQPQTQQPFQPPHPGQPPQPQTQQVSQMPPPHPQVSQPQLNQQLQVNQALQISQQLQVNQPPSPSSLTSNLSGPAYPINPMAHKKIYPLPFFTGLPEEWQTFYEAFVSTTSEFGYSSLHNIMRLREALKDRARETVESLLGSSANVEAIMDILQETFGRPEQLIRSQIEKVRAIAPIANDNLEALVSFANKITNMATFLQNAKAEHHLSNPSLLSELVAKLSTSRQMQWAEKCLQLQHPATIVDFSNWLSVLRRLANIVHDTLPIATTSSARRHVGAAATQGRKYACVGVAVQQVCPICKGECTHIKNCSHFLKMSIDDRWQKVKEIRTCFCCLKQGHQLKDCHTKRRCGISDCQRSHNRLLHKSPPTPAAEANHRLPTQNTDPHNNAANIPEAQTLHTNRRNCHAARTNDSVMFQVLPVTLYGKHKHVNTYAFIDDGANVSMLDINIARELELKGEPEYLELQWLNDQRVTEKVEKINLTVSGVGKYNKKYSIGNVYISSQLSLPVQSCQMKHLLESQEYEEIANIPLRDYVNVKPTLILSLQHAYLTVPLEIPRMLTDVGPIVTVTRLGAVIYGPIPGEKGSLPKRALHIRKAMDSNNNDLLQELHNMMRGYFDIETLGTKANIKPLLSKDDERAMVLLKQNTRKINGRYECSLLWKDNIPPIPDSFNMALNRLYSVERKMARDREYSMEYCNKIKDYVEKGYCRKISQEEKCITDERTFYLPHFGVTNPNKKGIRIVFDAAAEIQHFSLNKALLSGPDINNTLISIIFKFRESPIAVCGDIQEMFHQIAIAKQDQNSQRFLWRNGNPGQPVDVYVMERMIFGATCSPTIAQYVKNVNAQTFIEKSPRAVHGIIDRHYVDDYVDCFESESEAISVVADVIKIHKAGGFNLRNIKSNSDRLQEICGNPARSDNTSSNLFKNDGVERVLGILWLPKPDVFCFDLKLHKVDERILSLQKVPTKREMLSLNMSIFDPFGFLCDFMVASKIMMQKVWKAGIKWDDELPPSIYGQWKTWLMELPKLREFSVPRYYGNNFYKSKVELHIFVDASEEAMAAVAYWRVVSSHGIKVVFVMGKTSCAPTRYHTIPKLELQAATMGVRMKDMIIKNHLKTISNICFWSDSSTVIQWIRSDHRIYKQYVANRVAEILETSQINQWRWCPGADNPADEATRAKSPGKYDADGRWKNGPAFLSRGEEFWPEEAHMGSARDESRTELRSKHRSLVARQVCTCVPDINRFSKYRRLKRAMAWVLRYANNLVAKVKGESTCSGELTVDEENYAENYLCRQIQQQSFGEDLADIRKNGVVSVNSDLRTLNPFIGQDKLLRVSGRIQNAAFLSVEARQPIILPKGHIFTRLLVGFYHMKFCHINTATVMSEIRLKFWVPSLRQLLGSVQSKCPVCKIRNAKPRQPQMAALPVDRVTPFVRAFTYTGLDFFGPVNVSIRRQREKRWVALFTCLSVRAVHLEIATDLSSDACLLCIRNFVNRRGVPVLIRSDNGTNFVGIAKELQGVSNFFDNDSFTAGVTALGIKWSFNTPANPSEGGVWERLVQSVKKALYIMLKEQAPKLDTLQAFLLEAENMVNSRPLTHLPVTPEDPEPLTPNHFLLGCTNSTQTPAPYEPRLMCLRKQWRVVQNLKNGMWYQWLREYLPELTRRTKWCLPSQPLNVGCLVFVCDPDLPRSQWKRGRVTELQTSKDGVARSAKVMTATGVYHRPVSKLAILDVVEGTVEGESSPPGSVHGGGNVADGDPGRLEANVRGSKYPQPALN